MTFCILSPRFYPVIGGVEIYFQNIAKFCSPYIKTQVITSNLKRIPVNVFDKILYFKNQYDSLKKSVNIIRANSVRNFPLNTLFFFKSHERRFRYHLKGMAHRVVHFFSRMLMIGGLRKKGPFPPFFSSLFATIYSTPENVTCWSQVIFSGAL